MTPNQPHATDLASFEIRRTINDVPFDDVYNLIEKFSALLLNEMNSVFRFR